jgi:hypothetical protein
METATCGSSEEGDERGGDLDPNNNQVRRAASSKKIYLECCPRVMMDRNKATLARHL